MNDVRKLSKKNTLSFNIFGVCVLLILVAFSVAVFAVIKGQNQQYTVSAGSTVYTEENEYVDMVAEGILQKKWDHKYYLKIKTNERKHTYENKSRSIFWRKIRRT